MAMLKLQPEVLVALFTSDSNRPLCREAEILVIRWSSFEEEKLEAIKLRFAQLEEDEDVDEVEHDLRRLGNQRSKMKRRHDKDNDAQPIAEIKTARTKGEDAVDWRSIRRLAGKG
eukprot:TRINITY_DN33742_c4_g1_i1.p2 TRINITY_DN33742_c4_g1~~TRINITY_DN33742_c4_g1_i1.p2  ORF type:complete len:115 (+),score=34.61 TRINITY_DN33742_c4_g1_i1:167-511(+)